MIGTNATFLSRFSLDNNFMVLTMDGTSLIPLKVSPDCLVRYTMDGSVYILPVGHAFTVSTYISISTSR